MSTITTGNWFSSNPINTATTSTVTSSGTITTSSNTNITNVTWNPGSTVSFPTIDESMGIRFIENGEEAYRFSSDVEAIEAMIHWIFENTTGRFFALGTSKWYFELEEDAVSFKLVFKGHKLVNA